MSSNSSALEELLGRHPSGIDVVPASRLDRHTFATTRAVAIALDTELDRGLLGRHYPAEVLAVAATTSPRDWLVLPARDPYADLASVGALTRIAERLRAPGGCPWDREQTHASLRPHLLEEAYEAIDALDSGDPGKLRDELGDLLFQVVIHAQLAAEEGTFDLSDVARSLGEKLVRRHPHVFAGVEIPGGDLLAQWERIKREERETTGDEEAPGVLGGLPRSQPALAAAERLQERAARVGIVPPRVQLPLDVDEEGFLGDVLFDIVAEAREHGFDAERALRDANARFVERVRQIEREARERGRSIDSYAPAELRELWTATT